MGKGPRVYGRGGAAGGGRQRPSRAVLPPSPQSFSSSSELRVRKDDTFDLVVGKQGRDPAPRDLPSRLNCTSSDSEVQSPLHDASPVFRRKKPKSTLLKKKLKGKTKPQTHLILADKSENSSFLKHYIIPVPMTVGKNSNISIKINKLLNNSSTTQTKHTSNSSTLSKLDYSIILPKLKFKTMKEEHLLPASSTPLKKLEGKHICGEGISPIGVLRRFNRNISKNNTSSSINEKDTQYNTAFESNLKSISEDLVISNLGNVPSLHFSRSNSDNVENEDPNWDSKPSENIAGMTSPDLFDSDSESIFAPIKVPSLIDSLQVSKMQEGMDHTSSLNQYKSKNENVSIVNESIVNTKVSHLQDLEKSSLPECYKNENNDSSFIIENKSDIGNNKSGHLKDLPVVVMEKLTASFLDCYKPKNEHLSFEIDESQFNTSNEKLSHLQDSPVVVMDKLTMSVLDCYKPKNEHSSFEIDESQFNTSNEKLSCLQDLPVVVMDKLTMSGLDCYKPKNEHSSFEIDESQFNTSNEKLSHLQDSPVVVMDKLTMSVLDRYKPKNEHSSFEIDESQFNTSNEKLSRLQDLPVVVMDKLTMSVLDCYKPKNEHSSFEFDENEFNTSNEKISNLQDLPAVVIDKLSSSVLDKFVNKKPSLEYIDGDESLVKDESLTNQYMSEYEDASFVDNNENESIASAKISHLQVLEKSSLTLLDCDESENKSTSFAIDLNNDDSDLNNLSVVVMEKLSSTVLDHYNNKNESNANDENISYSQDLSNELLTKIDQNESNSIVNLSDDSVQFVDNEMYNFVEFKRRVTSQLTCENFFTSSIDNSQEESEESDASSFSGESQIDDSISKANASQVSINELDNQTTHNSDKSKTVCNSTDEFSENTLKNVSVESDDQFDLKHDIKKNVLPIRRSVRLQKKNFRNFRKTDVSNSIFEDPSIDDRFHNTIVCQPGKRFERSMSIIRQMSNAEVSALNVSTFLNDTLQRTKTHMGRKYQESVEQIMNLQPKLDITLMCCSSNISRRRKSTIILNDAALEENTVDGNLSISEKSEYSDTCDDTAIALSELSISRLDRSRSLIEREQLEQSNWRDLSARDIVLRKCNQTHYLPFAECYPSRKLKNCCKIGEGVYGEVFLYKNELDPAKPIVMKIIPVEGTQLINGEPQKKFDEIISEIVIAMELSNLRNNDINGTSTFNKVHQIKCVQGSYPERLLELWELFDETKGSENEHPLVFGPDQLFIVLELENGGNDLEAFVFANAEQSFALFNQIAFGLAVSEESLQFEHRDLHWGNVLVTYTDEHYIDFTLRGVTHSVRSGGISASIIDFTLSRITLPQVASAIYNDLACDEDLFSASGDYQFDIYRLMRKKTCNDWQRFEPYTNVLWLHYLLSKMVAGLRYEKPKTKIHNIYMSKLKKIHANILNYQSCVDFVLGEENNF